MRTNRRFILLLTILFACCACRREAKLALPEEAPAPTTLVTAKPRGERTENPLYLRWSKFPPGTIIVFKETTDQNATKMAGTTEYRLVSVTEEKAVVQMQGTMSSPDGTLTKDPASELVHVHWFELPAGRSSESFWKPEGVYEEGEETLNLADKAIAAHWYKFKGRVEAGETNGQLWISNDVPGGVVKSLLTVVPTKKVVLGELAEWKAP